MLSHMTQTMTSFLYHSYQKLSLFTESLMNEEDDEKQDLPSIEISGPFPEYILNIVPLDQKFLEKKPEKILVLDIDNTLFHLSKSTEPGVIEPELLFEEKFQSILTLAKQMNTLVVIGTARAFHLQYLCRQSWQVSEIIKKLDNKNIISAVCYTNNFSKYYLLSYLKDNFQLTENNICLIDDSKSHRKQVKKKGFQAVDIFGEKPFEKMVAFLNPAIQSEIIEPTTPVVQEYYLFSKPKRTGFSGLRNTQVPTSSSFAKNR